MFNFPPQRGGPIWNPSQISDPWGKKILDLSSINKYPGFNIFNVEVTPWYRDWSTWMWIAGGICAIGTLYLGYKLTMDPLFIESIWSKNPTIVETGATPPMDPGPSNGPGTIAAAASTQVDPQGIIRKVANIYHKTIYKLNPINWITPAHETQREFNAFLGMQNDIVRAENTLYPFTDNNPYDSWLKRLRIRWLGETTAEILERKRLIAFAHSDYEQIRVKGGEVAASAVNSTVNSTTNSPLLPGLGLPLPKPLTSGHVIWSATSSNANV
jgi:hypothetical protein